MENSLERTMANLFLVDNNDTNIYKLNRSAINYFYSLPSHTKNQMDISYFWGLVVKKWAARQELKKEYNNA